MAATLALLVYLPALAVGLVAVWRRPVLALYAFAVGLAFHNLVMALLYGAGVTGFPLDLIQAWKELLLARRSAASRVDARARTRAAVPAGAGRPARARVRRPRRPLRADPAGRAGRRGRAERDPAVRTARPRSRWRPTCSAARSCSAARELRRLAWTILGTAAAVAAIGLVEEYAVVGRDVA